MTYQPSEDLINHLRESPIMSYRLVDGSYVIAEEIDMDEDNNVLFIAGALELVQDGTKSFLKAWINSDSDELIELAGDKIVGRTQTPLHIKLHYHRYNIIEKLHEHLTKNELDQVLDQMFFPQVDNQDFTDKSKGEEWKVDKGIVNSNNLKKDLGYKSASDYHTEWRKKHKGNN